MTDQESQVMAAAAEIVDAFRSNDDPRYFSRFADDAVFVFHTTAQRLRSRAAYEAEMASWREQAGFKVLACDSSEGQVISLGPDAAAFVHDVVTTLIMDGVESTVRERETIVFRRVSNGWLAVHEHLSPAP